MGKLRLVFGAIGIALDIRDIGTLIRKAIGSAAEASVIAGVLKWLNQNVPTPSLILFGVAAFLLLLLFSPDFVGFIRRKTSKRTQSASRAVSSLGETPKLSPEQDSVLNWYEGTMKQQWAKFIRMDLVDVDCSHVGDTTPRIILKIHIRNYHLCGLKLLKIEEGKVTAKNQLLPRLRLDREHKVAKCDENHLYLDIEVHGTDIPNIIRQAEMDEELVGWIVSGTWKADLFGASRDIRDPSEELRWWGVPKL